MWFVIPIWTQVDAGKDSEEASFWDYRRLSPCVYLPSFPEQAVRAPASPWEPAARFLLLLQHHGIATVGKCHNYGVPQCPVCLL